MTDSNQLVAEELKVIEALDKTIKTFRPSDENYQENIIKSLELLAVYANECLESRAEYDSQNKECLALREQHAKLERDVAYARSSVKNATLNKNKEFYDSFLKASIVDFKAILDKYSGKFEDSVDDKAKPNFDGISLIYNSYKNSLVFLGLHSEEEAPLDEEKNDEVEVKAEDNKDSNSNSSSEKENDVSTENSEDDGVDFDKYNKEMDKVGEDNDK